MKQEQETLSETSFVCWTLRFSSLFIISSSSFATLYSTLFRAHFRFLCHSIVFSLLTVAIKLFQLFCNKRQAKSTSPWRWYRPRAISSFLLSTHSTLLFTETRDTNPLPSLSGISQDFHPAGSAEIDRQIIRLITLIQCTWSTSSFELKGKW